MSATVLMTLILDGELDHTDRIEFDDLDKANAFADCVEGEGCVGCVKVGDKIKRVF